MTAIDPKPDPKAQPAPTGPVTAAEYAEAAKRMSKARSRLVLDAPFWGALSLGLKLRPAPRGMLPQGVTMGTDGRAIWYSPRDILALPPQQLVGDVAHEVAHVAALHPMRRGKRDHKKFNVACDFAVNGILKDAGFELSEGSLYDEEYRAEKGWLSAEQIFERLPQGDPQGCEDGEDDQGQGGAPGGQGIPMPGQGAPQPGQGNPGASDPNQQPGQGGSASGQGPAMDAPSDGIGDPLPQPVPQGQYPGNSVVMDYPLEEGQSMPDAKREGQRKVTEAAFVAQMAGKGTGPAEALTAQAIGGKVPWEEYMQQFLRRSQDDYSFRKPDRRFMARGFVMPGLDGEGLQTIALFLDTSDSIQREITATMVRELGAFLDAYPTTTLHVLYHTDQVYKIEEYSSANPPRITSIRGGGTDFRPCFEYLEKNCIEADAIVMLTDCYGPAPASAPETPVLVVSYGAQSNPFPFGEFVLV